MNKVYIAGKISGDCDYKNKFQKAQEEIERLGHVVLSPAILPFGFEQSEYMRICLAMIDVCDIVVLLPDYLDSEGALFERQYAKKIGKNILGLQKMLDNL